MIAHSPSRPKSLQLEKLRQAKRVSLDEISELTKIGKHFLLAIEAEEFEKLPGGIFNLNYLRQYAEAVGFDAARLLAHYRAWMEQANADATPAVKPVRWSFGW